MHLVARIHSTLSDMLTGKQPNFQIISIVYRHKAVKAEEEAVCDCMSLLLKEIQRKGTVKTFNKCP